MTARPALLLALLCVSVPLAPSAAAHNPLPENCSPSDPWSCVCRVDPYDAEETLYGCIPHHNFLP